MRGPTDMSVPTEPHVDTPSRLPGASAASDTRKAGKIWVLEIAGKSATTTVFPKAWALGYPAWSMSSPEIHFGALTDVGINDRFMKDLATEDLKPGEAVLFVLVRKVTGDKVLAELKGVGGRVLQTSLDHTREEALRKALAGDAPAPTA